MQIAILLGTSYSSIPILKNLKKLNLFVIACGNNPKDVCVSLADEYIKIDYSNKQKLYLKLKEKKFDFLIPSCNDFAYISGSYIAEKLCLPGYDTHKVANKIFQKNYFRKFLIKNKIPSPKYINLNNKIAYPFLIKPVDSFSGKGIAKIANLKELDCAMKTSIINSRSKKVLAEEYIDGSLHSHSAFIKDKKIIMNFFVDEFCTAYKYQVNSSNSPSTLNKKIKNEVINAISKIIVLLELNDGLLHTQFIVNGNSFYIIESMRRCPGDLYPHLIEKSTNHNYWEYYVLPFVNKKIVIKKIENKLKYFSRHTISSENNFLLQSIKFKTKDFKEVEYFPLKQVGENIEAAPNGKAGIIFFELNSVYGLAKTKNLLVNLKVE